MDMSRAPLFPLSSLPQPGLLDCFIYLRTFLIPASHPNPARANPCLLENKLNKKYNIICFPVSKLAAAAEMTIFFVFAYRPKRARAQKRPQRLCKEKSEVLDIFPRSHLITKDQERMRDRERVNV
jgi:hypothetical protein